MNNAYRARIHGVFVIFFFSVSDTHCLHIMDDNRMNNYFKADKHQLHHQSRIQQKKKVFLDDFQVGVCVRIVPN